uniref:Candidate secreted effector n=1 Tax=Meloidogyne incognita TaxID=6306 RepID=A0A914LP50_MELIC
MISTTFCTCLREISGRSTRFYRREKREKLMEFLKIFFEKYLDSVHNCPFLHLVPEVQQRKTYRSARTAFTSRTSRLARRSRRTFKRLTRRSGSSRGSWWSNNARRSGWTLRSRHRNETTRRALNMKEIKGKILIKTDRRSSRSFSSGSS